MKPFRQPARQRHRLSAAAVIVMVFLISGCGTFSRSSRTPPDLPPGALLEEHAAPDLAWWRARFRFSWSEGESPDWFMDLLVADRLIKPVLIEHRKEIALWRVHRRAIRDNAGHQFSFIFYADRATARRILEELGQDPMLVMLHDAAMLDSLVFDDPDGDPDTDLGATSDRHWSGELQTAWPYYIMGVSAMWLELIHEVSDGVPPPDGSAASLGHRRLRQDGLQDACAGQAGRRGGPCCTTCTRFSDTVPCSSGKRCAFDQDFGITDQPGTHLRLAETGGKNSKSEYRSSKFTRQRRARIRNSNDPMTKIVGKITRYGGAVSDFGIRASNLRVQFACALT